MRWLAFALVLVLSGQSDPNLHLGTIRVNGLGRSFAYYVPPALRPGAPVVFVLHGAGGNGSTMRANTSAEFDRLADQHGFLVVYPDGYENRWNDCRKNATTSAHTMGLDDAAFLHALVQRFRAEYRIDAGHVYAMGFSNGGMLALRLALEHAREYRAIAAVGASMPSDDNNDCKPSGQAVPMLVMVGTDDPLVRNALVAADARLSRTPEETMKYFLALARAVGEPELKTYPDLINADSSTVESSTWRVRRMEFRLYVVRGGGHSIPQFLPSGRSAPAQSRRNADISAPAEIWSFFSANR